MWTPFGSEGGVRVLNSEPDSSKSRRAGKMNLRPGPSLYATGSVMRRCTCSTLGAIICNCLEATEEKSSRLKSLLRTSPVATVSRELANFSQESLQAVVQDFTGGEAANIDTSTGSHRLAEYLVRLSVSLSGNRGGCPPSE